MPKIITITNNKGGVAKTATTKNLAKALSLKDKKVGVVDMDDQNNLTDSCKPDCGFDLIPTDKSLQALQNLCGLDYEFVLLDNPPDLSQEAIHSYLISDYLLIPTTLASNSIKGMLKTVEAMQTESIKKYNTKLELLGVLVTMFDRRDREADKLLNVLRESLAGSLLDSVIRISSSIRRSDDEGQTVQDYEKPWYKEKKSTIDFGQLADEIIQKTTK